MNAMMENDDELILAFERSIGVYLGDGLLACFQNPKLETFSSAAKVLHDGNAAREVTNPTMRTN